MIPGIASSTSPRNLLKFEFLGSISELLNQKLGRVDPAIFVYQILQVILMPQAEKHRLREPLAGNDTFQLRTKQRHRKPKKKKNALFFFDTLWITEE